MNLKNFKKELKELLKKHNAALGVDIDGDTFGINVNGFIVIDCKNDKKTILHHYSLYLDVCDIDI